MGAGRMHKRARTVNVRPESSGCLSLTFLMIFRESLLGTSIAKSTSCARTHALYHVICVMRPLLNPSNNASLNRISLSADGIGPQE